MTGDAAAWRSEELFDRTLYERLDEETGGAGPEIVATLLSVASERKLAMIAAATEGKADELSRIAHTTKSGARSVGLLRLFALCDMIEHLPAGEPSDLAAYCPDIERAFDESIFILQKLQRE